MVSQIKKQLEQAENNSIRRKRNHSRQHTSYRPNCVSTGRGDPREMIEACRHPLDAYWLLLSSEWGMSKPDSS